MVILINNNVDCEDGEFKGGGGSGSSTKAKKDALSMAIAGGDSIFFPLSPHALTTLQNLGKICPESTMRASPFCHESPLNQREVHGWVLDTPSSATASALPIPYNLFHGITVALCDVSESEVLGLMQNVESTRSRLSQAIVEIMEPIIQEQQNGAPGSQRASWARCRPSEHNGHPPSLLHASRDKDGNVVFQQDGIGKSTPIIDSEDWLPELSPDGYIGFFHHWHHGTRESKLCLYVVCQSYLPKACIEFADMVHRAGELCTAGYVCLSDEAQWLRTACSRNRARLISDVCRKMNIKVPTATDYNSGFHRNRDLAIITTETLHHDMMIVDNDKVRILDHCSETRYASNGIACSMAPWEGVWIFQGLHSTHGYSLNCTLSASIPDFGKPYGVNVILPTSSPRIETHTTTNNNANNNIGNSGPYMFVAADPMQCKPLQIWDFHGDDDDGGGGDKPSKTTTKEEPIIVVSQKKPAVAACAVSTEGLDPDVVEAFQKSMSLRACPISYQIPNIPGTLPTSDAHNYLVFDEQVLNSMSRMGWSRTQGIIKLTPLACGLYEHLKKKYNNGGLAFCGPS